MNKYCIVGAGISGITIAESFSEHIVLEKSKGIGGRIASRRLGEYELNHGVRSLSDLGFDKITNPHGWIKNKTQHLNIVKSWEASHFESNEAGIKIFNKEGSAIDCENLILTCPAPQAKNILQRSSFPTDFLDEVLYKSTIQFMILAQSDIDFHKITDEFTEVFREYLPNNRILILFELRDQFVSSYLNLDKNQIKNYASNKLGPGLIDCHAHRWLYSEVTNSIPLHYQLFFKDKNIFLAGDYFGEHGIKGALKSANSIISFLKSRNKKVYRISKSPFGVLLFPTPVDKSEMFLIKAESEFQAKIYKHLLDFGALSAPTQSIDQYIKEGVHTDNITNIYRLNWEHLQLRFLPSRELDLDRACKLEDLIAKKFIHLLKSTEKQDEIIKDIQFRFSQQQLCPECVKLGIKDPQLQDWFQNLGDLFKP